MSCVLVVFAGETMPIDSKAAAQVPVTFVYRAEGPSSSVRLTGCFLSWSSAGVPCERSAENLFSTVQLLPPGSRVLFKFIVDGAWVCSPSYPISDDGAGNRNNVLDVMAPLGGGGGGWPSGGARDGARGALVLGAAGPEAQLGGEPSVEIRLLVA